MAVKRDIKYINRDFNDFRDALVKYTQTYFPTTYNDFTPASPGMMFMEMAAYVGDVLSFYLDKQIQESFVQFATEPSNMYQLAYMFGYKPKLSSAATADIDLYQQVPASGSVIYAPDLTYALVVEANSPINSTLGSTPFVLQDSCDFTIDTATDPTEVTVYSQDGSGNPLYYLLKKTKKAISATINTTTFTFGIPEKFTTVNFTTDSFLGILDITDSEGNTWYEVDYLAQDMVYDSVRNTNINDPNFSGGTDTPFLLKLKSIQRRFITRILDTNTVQLQFGAGTTNDNDAEIVPNPDNVGLGLPFGQSKLNTAFDPTNFIFTNTYGIAPSNTTLTVRYLTGGGAIANVPANLLTVFQGTRNFANNQTNNATADQIFNSFAITNPSAAEGGGDGDSIDIIRQNILASYNTQLRAVTQDDYLIRALSLPSQYGAIAKAYIEPTKAQNTQQGEIPSVLDLYVLGYNNARNLTTTSTALKTNLITYLSQYRMVGDSIRIKDGFIVNIGVDFEIITLPNFNNNEVLLRCITELITYFNIDKWQINQPIILRDVTVLLDRIEGVQTVKKLTIVNKVGEELGYSNYAYDLTGATLNNVIYPSLDPCIFEVKYPSSDITGRVVTL